MKSLAVHGKHVTERQPAIRRAGSDKQQVRSQIDVLCRRGDVGSGAPEDPLATHWVRVLHVSLLSDHRGEIAHVRADVRGCAIEEAAERRGILRPRRHRADNKHNR
jgi:hypothetical protein